FQAEDGIRDGHVTGVQTCALPIFQDLRLVAQQLRGLHDRLLGAGADLAQHGHHLVADPGPREAGVRVRGVLAPLEAALAAVVVRSEERRVGKECRSWWWPYVEKKK